MEQAVKSFPALRQGMSKFQIQRLLLNDVEYPTHDSKYWQCALELWVRFTNLKSLQFRFERTNVRLERARRRLKKLTKLVPFQEPSPDDDLRTKLLEITIRELEFQQQVTMKEVTEALREMRAFANAMDSEEPLMEHPEDPEAGELEKWYYKGIVDSTGVRVQYDGSNHGR